LNPWLGPEENDEAIAVVIPFKSGLFFEYNEKIAADYYAAKKVVIPFKSGLFFELKAIFASETLQKDEVVIPFKSGLFFECKPYEINPYIPQSVS